MTITLSQETEALLEAKAAAAGLQVDLFAAHLLEREVGVTPRVRPIGKNMDDFFRQLRELSSTVASVPDPKFTRETMYQDHN